MIVTLHGMSTMYANLATDIRLAGETGFAGIEMTEVKLLRYLDQGNDAESVKAMLEKHSVEPRCINAIKGVEVQGPDHQHMLEVCERLCTAAAIIGCPVGFVGAAESKDALWADQPVPCCIVKGRLGGSAITVAAINAIASRKE